MENPAKALSEGITLLALSAVSYAGAYLYEFGYAGHFGIPKEYIFVDTRGLIVFSVVFFCISTVIFQLLNFMALAREGNTETPYRKLLKKHSTWFGIPIIFGIVASSPLKEWLNLLLIPLVVLSGDILAPFALRNRSGGFEPALGEWLKDGGSTVPMPLSEKILSNPGTQNLAFIYLLAMLLMIAHAMGAGEARRKTDFLTNFDESKIALRRYGNDWLFAEYNRTNGSMLPRFSIVDFSKEKTDLKLFKRAVFDKIELPVSSLAPSIKTTVPSPATVSQTNTVK